MKIAMGAGAPKGSRNVLAALAGAFMVSEIFPWEPPLRRRLGESAKILSG
jgi:hypothetical protein